MQQRLLDVFRDLVRGIAPWPLYLYGPPGVGKSSAALALLDCVRDGQYQTAGGLTRRVLAGYNGGPRVDWGLLAPQKCELFVLDELGVRRAAVSDTHYECVQEVLDAREDHPLVLISNLDLQTLATVYDTRIADRCGAGTLFELAGDSRRTG